MHWGGGSLPLIYSQFLSVLGLSAVCVNISEGGGGAVGCCLCVGHFLVSRTGDEGRAHGRSQDTGAP